MWPNLHLRPFPLWLTRRRFTANRRSKKIIKALLVAATVTPPRTHDIETLADKASALYPTLQPRMLSFVRLTEWLTASRYPDLGGGLGEEQGDVVDMVALVKAFRHRFLDVFNCSI